MRFKPKDAVWVGVDLWDSDPGIVASRKHQIAAGGSDLVAVWIVGSRAKEPKTVVSSLVQRRFPTCREIIDGTAR